MMKPLRKTALLILTTWFPLILAAQGFIVSTGAMMIQTNGNVVTPYHWANNGTFTHTAGTLIFNGSSQNLGGSTQTLFNNITVNSGSTTSITSAGQKVKGILLCNGTVNSGGNLILASLATQTGLIDGSGTGSVTGRVVMQRYLPNAFGYKYFSTAFSNAKVSEFSEDMDLNASFPTFYRYNENATNTGWVRYNYVDSSLVTLQGYAANFGPVAGAKTVTVGGTVNNGNYSRTLYNHNKTFTLGFNLVGNPYPSPVNWDATSGWTKTNIDNALYYFDASDTNQYWGKYSTYINGISSDGIANGIIGSLQSFFVHVTNGSYPVTGTLGVTNSVRVRYVNPAFHKDVKISPPLVRLYSGFVDNAGLTDPTVIYISDSASLTFDPYQDALKLFNTDETMPSVYSLTPDSTRLSINALPVNGDSVRIIPLGVKTWRDGIVFFRVRDIENFATLPWLYFSDSKLHALQDLMVQPEYRANLTAGECDNRFALVLSLKDLRYVPGHSDPFYVYSSGTKIYIYSNAGENEQCDMTVYNMIGQKVYHDSFYGSGYHIFTIPVTEGFYLVSVKASSGFSSRKVYLNNAW
jgi:hypothetical protein